MDYQSVSRRFVFLLIRFMDFGADVAIVVLLILLRAKGVCVLGWGGGEVTRTIPAFQFLNPGLHSSKLMLICVGVVIHLAW